MEVKHKKKQHPKHIRHTGLGAIESITEITNGLIATCNQGSLRVIIYSHAVIRIQVSDSDTFDELSYAVVASPDTVDYEFSESTDQLLFNTNLMQLIVDKKTSELSFFHKNGQLLNQDCPGLGTSLMGDSKTVYKSMQKEERFIGLGEKTGNLDRRGSGYVNRNTDSFAYGTESDPLYCSIPFYIGLHDQKAYGLFLDNTYESHFNFGASNDRFSSFTVRGGDINYYFIHAPKVAEIISSYTWLTGTTPLPPLWGLGYQQCRYSYYPEEEVYTLAGTFRKKQIPADAIVLDIHYMEAYKIFTWDHERFPKPKQMIKDLSEEDFNVVVMCDPGIKIEEGYAAYEEGVAEDLFLTYPDGERYSGQVWPGWCNFPDFTNPNTRKWWGEKLQFYSDQGVKGYWNDMNEIATWGQKLPELIEFDFEGEGGAATRGRNIYGLMMSKATYEGARKNLGDQRPFNLTRAAYSGIQRYAAVWTGDNVSTDEHMLLGTRLVNSLGLSGIAYCGYDVGGFVGEASSSLFARWISIGAFSPFFRGHSMINSRDSEPWSFGEEVEDISRNYINLRYRLIPYIYSLFYEAYASGMPVARSLAIDYSFDPRVYFEKYQNQYLFGPGILVAPVESYKQESKVFIPEGDWFNFHTEEKHQGPLELFVDAPLTHLPLFIKAGSIIPMQSLVQSTQQQPEPILQLHIYAGADGEFLYYEDDGSSYHYQKDEFHKRTIAMDWQARRITFGAVVGAMSSKFDQIRCYLHQFEDIEQVTVDQNEYSLQDEAVVFLPAISSFDPLGSESHQFSVSTQVCTFENSDKEFVLSF